MDNPYATPDSALQQGLPPLHDPLDRIPASGSRRWVAHTIDNLLALSPVFGALVLAQVSGNHFLLNLMDNGLAGLLLAILSAFVYGSMEASGWEASIGKRLLGIRVIRTDGQPMTSAVALKRNFLKYIGLTVCGLLAFTVLRSSGRSLWDNASNTMVVRALK